MGGAYTGGEDWKQLVLLEGGLQLNPYILSTVFPVIQAPEKINQQECLVLTFERNNTLELGVGA